MYKTLKIHLPLGKYQKQQKSNNYRTILRKKFNRIKISQLKRRRSKLLSRITNKLLNHLKVVKKLSKKLQIRTTMRNSNLINNNHHQVKNKNQNNKKKFKQSSSGTGIQTCHLKWWNDGSEVGPTQTKK